MSHPLRLALYPNTDDRWIAGILHSQNVVRALSYLPDSERPEISLILRPKHDGAHYDQLRNSVSSTYYFDTRKTFNIKKRKVPWLKRCPRVLKNESNLEDQLQQLNADVIFPVRYNLGQDFPVPWISWIPDFQHKYLPELFSPDDIAKRDQLHQCLIDESAHTIVSSEDARKDLLHFYQASSDQISVYNFHTYPEPTWFEGNPIATASKYELPEKFLMFPSQFWKHKNHLTLLQAILELRERESDDICLVLTGVDQDYSNPKHPETLKRFIETHQLKNQVRYLGLLPRQEQIHLMRRACAIAQPSFFEGWSMLVEDCRALGKTVFLSDLPVHREQGYAKTHYFAPASRTDLVEVISKHWPTLKAGPDLEAEAFARKENETLSMKNGRQLLEILQKTKKSPHPDRLR
jgi:glycosyltransferase involved in cell wall biosynthesis